MIAEFETVIHELLHGYNGQGAQAQHRNFFIAPGNRPAVPSTDLFSSREINRFVSQGKQDSIFRYGTYVAGKPGKAHYGNREIGFNNGGNNDISSVSEGIYGLVEEFNAYYFGTLTTWELMGYYKDNYGPDAQQTWSNYKHQLLGNAVAYYEFRLFIAWYLLVAKKSHKDTYQAIQENRELRRTFSQLEKSYGDLVALIEKELPALNKLSGPDVGDFLARTGTDEELRAFLAESGVDAEAMGIKPGTPEWESLRQEFIRSMGELQSSIPEEIDFFHAQPKAQMAYLKNIFGEEEKTILTDFRLIE